MGNPVIDFYSGFRGDHRGRRLAAILSWPDQELERVHDFIQWLFPLPEASPVNPDAPLLDPATAAQFRARPELRDALRESLLRMIRFYGLELADPVHNQTKPLAHAQSPPESASAADPAPRVEWAANFATRAEVWLWPGNHNHLRITRILRCATLAGLEAEARALLDCLEQIAAEYPDRVTSRSLAFWHSAVKEE